MATDKWHLENTLHGFLNLILMFGSFLCTIWIVLLLYSTIWLRATPHVYEPQVSVIFPENTVSVAATHANSQFLTMRGWNVQLVTFEDASVASAAIQLGWILLRPVLMLIVVWLVRKILISIMAGEPFHERAPARLKAIGWLVIAGAVGRAFEDFLVGLYVKNHYALSKGAFAASFDYSSMLWGSAVGVMVIILAGVFRYGRVIRQEQELTV